MIDSPQIAKWLSRLVQIPSVTPDQGGPRAGETGEAKLAAQIAGWFQDLGGTVRQQAVLPNRANTYGVWHGTSDQWLAVDVHIDTVGVEQMTGDPFSGDIQAGRIHGRGAVDTKATLGVILAILEQMQQSGLQPSANLLIAATVDEEIGATGAPACATWMQAEQIPVSQLIVAEPTLCTPVYGHKGVARFTLDIAGQAAHSSQPELGQNAITAMARIISAFDDEHTRLQTISGPLGSPSLTVSLVEGGTGINVVPDHCQISVDRRVVAGENATEIIDALSTIAQSASPLSITQTVLHAQNAFLQDPDTPLVHQLSEWSGQTPEVAPYGTNAWAYTHLDCECIVIGPGSIDQAHGAEEWVEIAQLEKMSDIYARWWGIA